MEKSILERQRLKVNPMLKYLSGLFLFASLPYAYSAEQFEETGGVGTAEVVLFVIAYLLCAAIFGRHEKRLREHVEKLRKPTDSWNEWWIHRTTKRGT